MKQRLKLLVVTIFVFSVIPCFGQENCYQTFYQKGEAAFQKNDFDAAIKSFKAAKVCPDIPTKNDIDDKIVAAQNGFINAIQKERKRAQSLALTAKSILELQKNDNATTAFRYAQYALEKDDNSESRSAFYEAAYQLETEERRLVYSKSFQPIKVFSDDFNGVEFSPGGNFITVLTSKKEILIFDLDGKLIASQPAYFRNSNHFSVSADESVFAYFGLDYLVHLNYFNGDSVQENFPINRREVRARSFSFSPNGKYFAIGYDDGLTQLYNTDGDFLNDLEGHGERITSLSFSKDDSLLITGNEKGIVGVWSTKGNILDTVMVSKTYNTEVIIAPDKAHFLVTSSGRRAFLFTIDGKEVFRAKGYFWDLSDENFSVKGEFVALRNNIYSLKKGKDYGKIVQTLPDWVSQIHFSKTNNNLVAIGEKPYAQFWKKQYNGWVLFGKLGGHTDDISMADFSPDGNTILTASYDGTIKLWPIESTFANSFYNAGKLLYPATLKDSTYAITHEGNDVYLWNVESDYNGFYGMPVDEIITISNDGKWLLTEENDMAAIWQFDPFGDGIKFLAGVSAFEPVHLGDFSKNKKALVMFLRDDAILNLTVWDLENQKTRPLGGNHGIVNALEWTSDSKQLLIGNTDGEVIIWNYQTPLNKMEIEKRWSAHDGQAISGIAASDDGKIIATASWDNTVKLWNTDFEYLVTLRGHVGEINTVDFSPDSRFVITASEDRTAKIWDTQGQLIVTLEGYPSDVKRAYFSPDMNYVLTNYGDGMIKSWPFNADLIKNKIEKFSKIDLSEGEKMKYGIE